MHLLSPQVSKVCWLERGHIANAKINFFHCASCHTRKQPKTLGLSAAGNIFNRLNHGTVNTFLARQFLADVRRE